MALETNTMASCGVSGYTTARIISTRLQASCTTMVSRGLQITARIIVQASYTMASCGLLICTLSAAALASSPVFLLF